MDIHSVAQSVEQQVIAALRPGHTDLMVSPESIDEFLEANPPPVEASGSEREDIKRWQADQSEFFQSNVLEIVTEYATWRDRQEARPQPSGETREALDRLKMAAHVYEDDEMAADCATLEALLSARPLALGGQQGVQERCQRCGGEVQGWLCQSCPAEFRENDDGHLVFDEDTTPARAEAQDEGAAGEPVVQWFKPSERTPESGKKFVALHQDGSGAWLGFMHDGGIIDADGDDYSQTLKGVAYWAYLPTGFEFCCEGYPEDPITLPGHVCPPLNRAHPSPPPAAQDDRLRKAVEALEEALPAMEWAEAHVSGLTKYDDPQQVVNCLEKHEDARDAVRSALAALKSEAAK